MKTKIKKSMLTIITSLIITNTFSQTSMNAASHTSIMNGYTNNYSIGEMILISTIKNGDLIVTQGYLQPVHKLQLSSSTNNWADQIKVYPNPTENILNIETRQISEEDIAYQLMDIAGKKVLQGNAKQTNEINKYKLDLSSFAGSTYFLLITKQNKDGKTESLSFKIQKIK